MAGRLQSTFSYTECLFRRKMSVIKFINGARLASAMNVKRVTAVLRGNCCDETSRNDRLTFSGGGGGGNIFCVYVCVCVVFMAVLIVYGNLHRLKRLARSGPR